MIINRLNVARLFFSFAKHSQGAKPQNNFQTFTSDLKNNKDVYAEYQKQVEKDTILRKFRRDVFKKEQISEEVKAYKQEMQKQSHVMQDLLHRGSKQEIIKYSKKIMEKLMNKKKVFKEQSLNPVFSDYGDYSSYRTNFVKIEDGKLGQLQRLDITTSTANVYKMLDELPDQYQEKEDIREQINQDYQHSNQNMSIADYGKVIQARLDREQHVTEGRIEYYDTYKEGINRLNRSEKTYYEDMLKKPQTREDLQTGANFKIGRLSPLAMDTIYESYLQGWSVRDISKRFGILPKRTKFVIWCRAQLYDELLPKYGWKFYFEGLQRQLQMGEEDGFVDYGLDLDEIRSSRLPEEIIQWNPNRVDAARKQQQYTLAMQKLEKLHKFDRHEKVQVGTHGKQNKMYLLKEWTIFRGKGSNKYFLENHTFRSLTKAKKKMVKEYY